MSPARDVSSVNPPTRRPSGREGPRELTAAFRRYVERVQSVAEPTLRDDVDVDAALRLAEEVMGHRRGTAVDATLARVHGASIRELAASVREAGNGAVARPALLARAIVLARMLERTGAGRFARERHPTGAAR